MATINFGSSGAARSVTQEGGYAQTSAKLDAHMKKVVVAEDEFFRVIPPYACDTFEIKLAIGATGQSPIIRIFGLDDDYDGSGAPVTTDGSNEKWEVPDDTPDYAAGVGFIVTDLPRTLIWDAAWKAIQFDVTNGSAFIKVKAYRSGSCTFEGSYITGSSEAS
jgi:hypothetical protein